MPTSSESYVLNPLCNIIIGFRNYTASTTRSKYVSFPLEFEPEICSILLDIANSNFKPSTVIHWKEHLIKQLVAYGLLTPAPSNLIISKIKNFFRNPINENCFKSLILQKQRYLITSFIFMAFTSQKNDDYINETVVLPHWRQKFARVVYNLVVNKASISNITCKLLRALLKHGVIVHTANEAQNDLFFQKNCQLSHSFLNQSNRLESKKTLLSKDESPYVINKKIYFSSNGSFPDHISKHFYRPEWFKKSMPSIIITDSVTHVSSAYWLSDKHTNILKKLLSQQMISNNLDEESLEIFTKINAIEKVTDLGNRRKDWQQKLSAARQTLTDEQYIVIHDLLNPVQLTMLRKYMKYLHKNKHLIPDKENGETKKRFWLHRENVTFYVHSQILEIINQILPSPVKIGHNAITIYEPSAILPKHKDDVLAFSWVMSLAIDTDPEIDREHAWPMYVQINGTTRQALLGMGDGALINPQMPHWRETLKDHTLGIMFFWFVNADFQGYVNGSWVE